MAVFVSSLCFLFVSFPQILSISSVFFSSLCLLFFSFPQKALSSDEICPTTYYSGDDSLSPPLSVQFPFVASNIDRHHRGGYPGFNLTTDDVHRTPPIISLPFSGNFTVLQINYSTQIISISDPDRCLPNRILTLNLTGSPFSCADSQYYTFLNCTEGDPLSRVRVRDAVAVPCLSGDNFTVYVTPSSEVSSPELSAGRCRLIKSVLAPIMSFRSDNILTRFDPGTCFMHLRWDVPDCRGCVYKDGWSACGFESESGLQVGCTGEYKPMDLVRDILSLLAICVALAILSIVCRMCHQCIYGDRSLPLILQVIEAEEYFIHSFEYIVTCQWMKGWLDRRMDWLCDKPKVD